MYLISNYTKEEVLTIIAEHAAKTLPTEKVGVIRATFAEDGDGNVEVFFMEDKDNSLN